MAGHSAGDYEWYRTDLAFCIDHYQRSTVAGNDVIARRPTAVAIGNFYKLTADGDATAVRRGGELLAMRQLAVIRDHGWRVITATYQR